MAGSLVKIDEVIVTSADPIVSLTGIDSTYDVYQVVINNIDVDTDAATSRLRVTVGGSADSTSNYDQAAKVFITSGFGNSAGANLDRIDLHSQGTGTGEQTNAIFYLFNFHNSSEYSFVTVETTAYDSFARLVGRAGGFVHTVAQSCDGVEFSLSSGNYTSGTFTLYGLKK
jgi:hypothetical protein